MVKDDTDPFNLEFNWNFFNNGLIRAQVHGYLDVFDQIKILKYGVAYHLKETDTLTNENTSQPLIYHAYDPDMQGRTVDLNNIQMLPNCKWSFMQPFTSKYPSIRPLWDMGQNKYGDVETGVRKVDSPWFDTNLLVSQPGDKAPSLKSIPQVDQRSSHRLPALQVPRGGHAHLLHGCVPRTQRRTALQGRLGEQLKRPHRCASLAHGLQRYPPPPD